MKLTIKRQNFLKLLTLAMSAIPAKSAETQFMNFLISAIFQLIIKNLTLF